MSVRRIRVNATVTASGGASQAIYSDRLNAGGLLEAIVFRNGNSTPASGISTAGHLNIFLSDSSGQILNVTSTGTTGEAVWYHPRADAINAGKERFGYASGAGATNGVPQLYPIGQGEGFKIEVTSAGTASDKKFFSIDFYIRDAG